MKTNNIKLWITGAAISASLVSTPAISAVVYEENFDQPDVIVIQKNQTPGTDWLRRNNTNIIPTRSTIGSGVLTIKTEDPKYGGASSTLSDTLDFFNQELTYTFSGFNLKTAGPEGRLSDQWAKVGVTAGPVSVSKFIVGFNGTGRFTVQVEQPPLLGSRAEVLKIKDFKVPFFSFDISQLSRVELVLDKTYFRILFAFGNPLDSISFAGKHGLDRDRWFFDTVNLGGVQSALASAETRLNNAKASGDQAAIASAQAIYDDLLVQYEAKLLEAEPLKGDTDIFVAAASQDASTLRADAVQEVGAVLTLDKITVETTNTLDVLKSALP